MQCNLDVDRRFDSQIMRGQTRSLGVLAALATLAALAGAFECPPQCVCSSDGAEHRYECELASGNVTLTTEVEDRVEIHCMNDIVRCEELFHISVGRGGELPNFSLTECSLAALGPLACLLAMFDARRLDTLTLKDVRGELRAEHVSGLNGMRALRMFDSVNQTSIPYEVLGALPSLKEFRMSGADLTLRPEGFPQNSSLTYLELSNDRIGGLPAGALRGLARAARLSLWGNRLQELAPHAFEGLDSLSSLELSRNELRSLPAGVFVAAPALTTLRLFANPIEDIHDTAFEGLLLLEEITIFDNRANLNLQPLSLANLPKLKKVHLANCRIQTLPPTLFSGSANITEIILSKNNISDLLPGLFRDQQNIEKLILDRNNIRVVKPEVFWPLKNLKELNLDDNKIEVLPSDLLSGLQRLKIIRFNNNGLKYIALDAFQAAFALEEVYLSNNELTLLGSVPTPPSPGINTQDTGINTSTPGKTDPNSSINESHSKINESRPDIKINDGSTAPESNNLDINDPSLGINVPNSGINDMESSINSDLLDPLFEYEMLGFTSPFSSLGSLRRLDLSRNKIKEIFSDWNFVVFVNLTYLDLSWNRIESLENTQFLSPNVTVDLTHNRISTVSLTPAAYFGERPYGNTILLAGNPIHCDCRLYPLLVSLHSPRKPSEPIINLGNTRCAQPSMLANLPVRNLSASNVTCPLDPNDCPQNCSCQFRPSTRLIEMTCPYLPKIPSLETYPAEGIDLRLKNTIKSLDLLPESVVSLELDGIGLVHVPDYGASTLRVLDLSRNALSSIPNELLQKNLTLVLKNNPFWCDCSHEENVFMLQQSSKIIDKDDLTCKGGQLLMSVDVRRLCSVRRAALLGGSLACVGLLAIIVAILAYRYSLEIKVFIYSREWLRWMIHEDDVDKDKLYDAFISFSHHDEEFVSGQLISVLESGPRPFKLCVHYRDWLIGEWIPAQIANSVEKSRRTIIVLSKSFLESVWGTLEFRVAYQNAQEEKRSRLVIVLLEDAPSEDMLDAELRAYLSTNTYVKWGDPWFWEKLRYALAGKRVDDKTRSRAETLGEKIAKSGLGVKLVRDGKTINGTGDLKPPKSPLTTEVTLSVDESLMTKAK